MKLIKQATLEVKFQIKKGLDFSLGIDGNSPAVLSCLVAAGYQATTVFHQLTP